jgi:hypothetical protein
MSFLLLRKQAIVMVNLILSYFGNKTLSITCTTPFVSYFKFKVKKLYPVLFPKHDFCSR